MVAVAALAIAGCRLPSNALDGPLAIPLRIVATPEAIQVEATTWFAPETAVYLCSTEPPALPEPGPARDGWSPGEACHDFGRVATADGLATTLSLEALSEPERPAFEAAADWYLLIVKLEGTRATAAIHSSFSTPWPPGT